MIHMVIMIWIDSRDQLMPSFLMMMMNIEVRFLIYKNIIPFLSLHIIPFLSLHILPFLSLHIIPFLSLHFPPPESINHNSPVTDIMIQSQLSCHRYHDTITPGIVCLVPPVSHSSFSLFLVFVFSLFLVFVFSLFLVFVFFSHFFCLFLNH